MSKLSLFKVTIHRGAEEIGGNAIELRCEDTRIVLDLGEALQKPSESLRKADAARLAALGCHKGAAAGERPAGILLSHSHRDHYGLIQHVHPDIPIFISHGMENIFRASWRFLQDGRLIDAALRREQFHLYDSAEELRLGPFTVKPLQVEHSAFHSHAFLISAAGKQIFYSGDLRAHGYTIGHTWHGLCKAMRRVAPIDLVLCEGTQLGNTSHGHLTEQEVPDRAAEIMAVTEGLVMAQFSPLNVARLVSFIKAALKAKRTFVIDPYAASVIHAIARGKSKGYCSGKLGIPLLTDKLFRVHVGNQAGRISEEFRPLIEERRIAPDEINMQPGRFLMLMRPKLLTDKEQAGFALERSVLIYSLWGGYRNQESQKAFEAMLTTQGCRIEHVHASGHLAAKDMQTLIDAARPNLVVPIHTEHGEALQKLVPLTTVKTVRNGETIDL